MLHIDQFPSSEGFECMSHRTNSQWNFFYTIGRGRQHLSHGPHPGTPRLLRVFQLLLQALQLLLNRLFVLLEPEVQRRQFKPEWSPDG